jgi:hypothetical protein
MIQRHELHRLLVLSLRQRIAASGSVSPWEVEIIPVAELLAVFALA